MRNFRNILYVSVTCFLSGYGAYFAYTAFYQGSVFNVIAGTLICLVGVFGLYGTFFGKPNDTK
ncbi:hypothetical protein [Pseudovibrio sp. Tun.PSC04-5.I4]|uniref:hypothetical protein n=1 Tax=Pseudovibrio sp. Tun.PSC04-5.I4 TaxID=1798213 RepID=UPI00088603CF|nr:hypothetical protein [Pseudovibrio sp. Tun.PSC04-5.I4]SDR22201.1 hypothetical protein SAMN04515695_3523 [Pseudovibrio sp. Tun.PSC04-5.I4]